ncbi:uncharacterized protein LOC121252318 [Juglans microcarpa x Juglans regia]|uniref:uncharacterized protein LOC121252318 n=1 Tax=Juglans microcarpa x Juglans regia TaxID=2249226 RepID=UPI001B7EAA7D|nr:uncharacterized protein LOC121252318 [Juglans microcarpa x Juglans regia]
MGVDLYSESSNTGTSPRISFSHDFCQSDVLVPVESRHHDLGSNSSGLSSSIDFDFCVHRESFGQESYAADELFSDGKILPTEIKKKITPMKQTDDQFGSCPPLPPPRAIREISKQESAMESKGAGRTEVNHDQKQSSKFFWRCTRVLAAVVVDTEGSASALYHHFYLGATQQDLQQISSDPHCQMMLKILSRILVLLRSMHQ